MKGKVGVNSPLGILISLSPRETQILEGVARGETSKQVAARLKMSSRTVEVHLARIRNKLHARSSSQAVANALMGGFLKLY